MSLKNILPIILILCLALFLRLYNLDKVPPSLFGDEIDVGYQAYSLLETGKDLRGHQLPFYLQSLYEYRAPLYIYSTVPFIKIFGLNEWGVRLPAVFWGVLSIFGVYLVTKNLFSKRIGELASFLLAISPWHLQYSRGSFEVTMLLTFLVFGFYFFLRSLKTKYFLLFSTVIFGLTFYIYSTATVFTSLFGILLLLIYRKDLLNNKKYLYSSIIALIIVLIPFIQSVYLGGARSRFEGVSIFQESVLLDKLNIARKSQNFTKTDGTIDASNPTFEKIFYNRPLIYLQVFSLNYLRALSPDFLFTMGDPNFRQSIHEMGNLYYFEIPLLLLGLLFLLTKVEVKKRFLVLGWLLLAPIPSALTSDGGFHATRLFAMLLPLSVVSSLGVNYLISNFNKRSFKVLVGILLVLAVFNVTFYLHRYYVNYPIESWRWWQTGFKESMLYMKSVEGNYNKIFFNETYEPSVERFLFWWQYPPSEFHKVNLEKQDNIVPGFNGLTIGNRYYFGNVGQDIGVINFVKPGELYLVSQEQEVAGDWDLEKSPPNNITVLKTVRNPQAVPIFYVITGK